MSPAPAGITIRPCLRSDLPEATRVWIEAFSDSEFHAAFFPLRHRHPQDHYRFALHLFRSRFAEPTTRYAIAEDAATGTMLGLACASTEGPSALARRWTAERTPTAGSRLQLEVERRLLRAEAAYARHVTDRRGAVNRPGITRFRADAHAIYDDAAAAAADRGRPALSPCLHCQTVVVRPGYQGRGIGRALLRWVLDAARAERLPVTLQSSARGMPLYLAEGFRVLGVLELDGGAEVPVLAWESEDCGRGQWGGNGDEDGQATT